MWHLYGGRPNENPARGCAAFKAGLVENPRWETYAQELAAWKPAKEAYVLAGYKFNEGNASRLRSNEKLIARVKELVERTAANAAARAQVTVESLMKELDEDRALARELGQASAAVSATVAKAKVAGLIVDRKEVGKPGEFEGMNVDELREHIARGIAALGIGASGVGEEGEGGASGGQLN